MHGLLHFYWYRVDRSGHIGANKIQHVHDISWTITGYQNLTQTAAIMYVIFIHVAQAQQTVTKFTPLLQYSKAPYQT